MPLPLLLAQATQTQEGPHTHTLHIAIPPSPLAKCAFRLLASLRSIDLHLPSLPPRCRQPPSSSSSCPCPPVAAPTTRSHTRTIAYSSYHTQQFTHNVPGRWNGCGWRAKGASLAGIKSKSDGAPDVLLGSALLLPLRPPLPPPRAAALPPPASL